MERSISEYVASEEFRKRMKRVSAKSKCTGISTPSEKIFEALAKSVREDKQKTTDEQ